MQTVEIDEPTLRDANTKLRQAVEARLSATANDRHECAASIVGSGVTPPRPATSIAQQTLDAAKAAVADRHAKYGPPSEHFSRTASLVNAAFGTSFSASDWALVMVLDKVARLRGPTPTTDGGVDIAGYGACYEEARIHG